MRGALDIVIAREDLSIVLISRALSIVVINSTSWGWKVDIFYGLTNPIKPSYTYTLMIQVLKDIKVSDGVVHLAITGEANSERYLSNKIPA